MRVYACAQFRDDCLSLLVALYSETACKDSINNWNMQTFSSYFVIFVDFCWFFQVFGGKMSLYGLFFCGFLSPPHFSRPSSPQTKTKDSQKGSLSFCCQTRTRTQTDRTRICSATITPLSSASGASAQSFFSKAGAKVLLFSDIRKFFCIFFQKKTISCIFFCV